LKQSLQRKYAGVIAGLIILITGVLSGILLFQSQSSIGLLSQRSAENMSRELMVQMEKRAEAMIHFLSDALTNPLYRYDVRSISELLEIVMTQKDVVNVYVYGTDGRIIHEGRDESANFGEPLGDSRTQEAIQTRGLLISQVEGNLLRVSIPIWIGDSPLGGVRLDMSLDGIVEDIDVMRGDLEHLGQQRLTDNRAIAASLGAPVRAVGPRVDTRPGTPPEAQEAIRNRPRPATEDVTPEESARLAEALAELDRTEAPDF